MKKYALVRSFLHNEGDQMRSSTPGHTLRKFPTGIVSTVYQLFFFGFVTQRIAGSSLQIGHANYTCMYTRVGITSAGIKSAPQRIGQIFTRDSVQVFTMDRTNRLAHTEKTKQLFVL